MKRTLLAFLSLAIFTSTVPASDIKGQPPATGTTRVAVVNIGLIFNHYERAQAFKAELEETLRQPKVEAKKLIDDMTSWDKASKNADTSAAARDRLAEKIVTAKRQLEDLDRDLKKMLGKKQEDNLITLWKEVQAGIRTYATEKGIDVVIGYGDPLDKAMLDLFPNVNRKMQAMDHGSGIPLFISPKADISRAVVDSLNKRYRQSLESRKTPPIENE